MKKTSTLVLMAVLLACTAMASTVTIRPDGQGYYSAWTNTNCGSGTSEWQCVDEATVNKTDLLQTGSTVKETFTFSNTGLSGVSINSVTIYYYTQQVKSQDKCYGSLIRSGGTDYSSTQLCSSSSWALQSKAYTTNPATGGAWTIAAVDSLEAGMAGLDPNGGGKVAQVYAIIDYTIADSCADTDGGNVPATQGTASGYYLGSPYSSTDVCNSSSMLTEFYCSGSYKSSAYASCGTDGYGADYCLNSSVFHDYTDYYCAGGACGSSSTPTLVESCDWGCNAGVCNPHPDSCADSDGGVVIGTLGTASGYMDGSAYSSEDYCVDASDVREYSCSGDYAVSSQQSCGIDGYGAYYCDGSYRTHDFTDYSCQSGACGSSTTPVHVEYCYYGCVSGSCNSPPDSCYDTDGGITYGTYGSVFGYSAGYNYNYTDFCMGSQILEWYCDNVIPSMANTTCANGCSSGACI